MNQVLKIKRKGEEISLTIQMYQNGLTLAIGSDGNNYIKKPTGKWTLAKLTVG